MVKQKIFLKQDLIINIIIITVLITGIFSSIKQYQNYKEYTYYNNARMLAADQINLVKECFIKGSFQSSGYQKGGYPVVIIDIDGNILYSDKTGYYIKDKINVNEFIQIDKSMYINDSNIVKTTFALEEAGHTLGFAAFFIPRGEAIGIEEQQVILTIFMPIIIGALLVLVLIIINRRYMKHHIIYPVNEIIQSSKAIIAGNYNVTVVKARSNRVMHNDIDKLSYNFELMRDELKEKRNREEELKRSQKELITCISHDLKTPISTIKAYSEGLRDGMAKDSEKVYKYAEIIVLKTELLNKMISDLLEHFNAELNKLTITKKEQYFNDYITQVAMEQKEVVNYNRMEFFYNNTAPNLLINFDENRITQVLTNLIDNSIKYGKAESGKIGIEVSYIRTEKQLNIKIWDNGQGVGITDIPYVFDKFYRGERSRNMSVPGSGLGLSICKYIIEEHGGQIKCESKKNEGTNFIISLPERL
jgi:signal transduction histidine kinase